MNKYTGMAVLSLVMFGFMPIFWSFLGHVDSYEILFHRCLWTCLVLIPFCRGFSELGSYLKHKWPLLLFSAGAIATNWALFIYTVTHNYIFEASLAYFLSPLMGLLFSFILLKESISKRQALAVGLVFLSILYLLIAKNILPTYAILIAVAFSVYGVLGKILKMPVIIRLTIESFLITLFMFIFMKDAGVYVSRFFEWDIQTQMLLVSSGTLTVIPLILYVMAVKNIPFATIGILSFILPTLVFLVGIFYFHETIDQDKMIALCLLWPSVALYLYDLLKKSKQPLPASE